MIGCDAGCDAGHNSWVHLLLTVSTVRDKYSQYWLTVIPVHKKNLRTLEQLHLDSTGHDSFVLSSAQLHIPPRAFQKQSLLTVPGKAAGFARSNKHTLSARR